MDSSAQHSRRGQVPLERLLSKWRLASRTQAQALIRAGRVHVGGRVVRDPRYWVDTAHAVIDVDGARVGPADLGAKHLWLALNKPRGHVSTTHDPEGRPTVMDLVRGHAAPGLAPVGRLDLASAGLLLLTNDATTADRLLDPRSHVEKVYRVKVKGLVSAEALESLRQDSLVEDGLVLGPMEVKIERQGPSSTWLEIRLCEGKNRQIRRRLEALGHTLEVLVRTRFGVIELGSLAPGSVRPLTPSECAQLLQHAAPAPPQAARKPSARNTSARDTSARTSAPQNEARPGRTGRPGRTKLGRGPKR